MYLLSYYVMNVQRRGGNRRERTKVSGEHHGEFIERLS